MILGEFITIATWLGRALVDAFGPERYWVECDTRGTMVLEPAWPDTLALAITLALCVAAYLRAVFLARDDGTARWARWLFPAIAYHVYGFTDWTLMALIAWVYRHGLFPAVWPDDFIASILLAHMVSNLLYLPFVEIRG